MEGEAHCPDRDSAARLQLTSGGRARRQSGSSGAAWWHQRWVIMEQAMEYRHAPLTPVITGMERHVAVSAFRAALLAWARELPLLTF